MTRSPSNVRREIHRGPLRRFAPLLAAIAACAATVAAAPAALADIPPPEPPTVWGRNQAPDATHVMIAGICISAAIVAGGLLVAWQVGVKTRAGKTGVTLFAVLLAVAVVLTIAVPLRIGWENEQWRDWERRDSVRRSRPRDFPDFIRDREQSPESPGSVKTPADEATRAPEQPALNKPGDPTTR